MPTYSTNADLPTEKSSASVVVYNFHSLMSQDRFFLFFQPGLSHKGHYMSQLASITELFSAANWLEREVSELSGISFSGKKDLRNLMLQYGDASAPFQKSFPTVGLKEMFYDPLKDTIIQNPVSLQI
jgi:NADH:ubiquinone oxidoreductase subunit C